MFVTPLFKLMSDKQASDMFFTAGAPIQIKINGTVMPVNSQALDPEQVKKICYELITEAPRPASTAGDLSSIKLDLDGIG